MDRHEYGRWAEGHAAKHYETKGYRLVAQNARVGRAEFDLVMQRGRIIAFVEVRALRSDTWGHPAETVDRAKIGRYRTKAGAWCRSNRVRGQVRLDVVAIVGVGPDATLEVYEDVRSDWL